MFRIQNQRPSHSFHLVHSALVLVSEFPDHSSLLDLLLPPLSSSRSPVSILWQIRSETVIFNCNIVIRFPPAPVDSPAQCLILWLSTQHSQLWPQLSGNWPIRDQHRLMIDQSQSSWTGGEVVWTWSCHCFRSNQRCLWYSSSWQDAGTLVQPRCSRGNTLQTHDCW